MAIDSCLDFESYWTATKWDFLDSFPLGFESHSLRHEKHLKSTNYVAFLGSASCRDCQLRSSTRVTFTAIGIEGLHTDQFVPGPDASFAANSGLGMRRAIAALRATP
jgi:hypothetical protein